MSTWDLLEADLLRTFDRPTPNGLGGRLKLLGAALPTIRGLAIIGFRLSNRVGQESGFGGAVLKQITHALTGADIGYAASIGPGLRILHPTGIVITDRATIGKRCTIYSCTIGSSPEGSPVIGNDVSIAPGARILGNVQIDDGCHVAANAVLAHSVPGAWKVLAGVPAKATRDICRAAPLDCDD
jgi:serine O-acetyltransferase